MNKHPRYNLRWIVCLLLLGLVLSALPEISRAQVVAAQDPWGQARARRDGELDKLKDEFSASARKRWPKGVDQNSKEYQDFLGEYSAKKTAINTKYVHQSGLPDEIEKLKSQGFKPSGNTKLKTVDSDIDMVGDSDQKVDDLAAEWEQKYGKNNVIRDKASGKIVNKRTNTTVWRPDPNNQYQAGRIADPDAAGTFGGRYQAGVRGKDAVEDPLGAYYDNKKKFEDALKTGDKKGQGKALSKIQKELGIPKNSTLARQADLLREGQDEFESGVVNFTDNGKARADKMSGFRNSLQNNVNALEKKAIGKSETILKLRDTTADMLERQGDVKKAAELRAKNNAIRENVAKARESLKSVPPVKVVVKKVIPADAIKKVVGSSTADDVGKGILSKVKSGASSVWGKTKGLGGKALGLTGKVFAKVAPGLSLYGWRQEYTGIQKYFFPADVPEEIKKFRPTNNEPEENPSLLVNLWKWAKGEEDKPSDKQKTPAPVEPKESKPPVQTAKSNPGGWEDPGKDADWDRINRVQNQKPKVDEPPPPASNTGMERPSPTTTDTRTQTHKPEIKVESGGIDIAPPDWDEDEMDDDKFEEDKEKTDKDEPEEKVDTGNAASSGILDKVTPIKVTAVFTSTDDFSGAGVNNIVTTTITFTFWNVGSLAPGYGDVSMKITIAESRGVNNDETQHGTFSGGPNGTLSFADVPEMRVSNGSSIELPEGLRATIQNPEAFSDWPQGF